MASKDNKTSKKELESITDLSATTIDVDIEKFNKIRAFGKKRFCQRSINGDTLFSTLWPVHD